MTSVEKVLDILNDRKIPVSRLERDLGFGNGYIKQLRKGEIPNIRLLKIARYLNVPARELVTDGNYVDIVVNVSLDETKKPATDNGDGDDEKLKRNIQFALFDGDKNVTQEDVEAVFNYYKFLQSQRGKK